MGITRYTWDVTTDSVMQESDGSGAVQAKYTRRPEMYGPLISQHRSGVTSYYHFDALGSTRALTDDSQTVTDSFTYDAWGNEVASSGSTVNTQRWVGRYGYQVSNELYYVRSRWYQSFLGMWTSVDSLYFTMLLLDCYIYAGSHASPVLSIDPSGMTPIDDLLRCRKHAWDTYNNCVDNSIANAKLVNKGCLTAALACAGRCAWRYKIRPIRQLQCQAGCLAAQISCVVGVHATLRLAKRGCLTQYETDMDDCDLGCDCGL